MRLRRDTGPRQGGILWANRQTDPYKTPVSTLLRSLPKSRRHISHQPSGLWKGGERPNLGHTVEAEMIPGEAEMMGAPKRQRSRDTQCKPGKIGWAPISS